jgi:hypothetical protein
LGYQDIATEAVAKGIADGTPMSINVIAEMDVLRHAPATIERLKKANVTATVADTQDPSKDPKAADVEAFLAAAAKQREANPIKL